MSFWSFLKRTLLTSESAVAASTLLGESKEQCTPYDLPIGDKNILNLGQRTTVEMGTLMFTMQRSNMSLMFTAVIKKTCRR